MKKILGVLLTMLLLASACAAYADGAMVQAHYLFGYVIDVSATGFEIITDNEEQLAFNEGDAMQVRGDSSFDVGDAVVVMYLGQLNPNAVQQAVTVSEVTVLSTLYGAVADATMNTITVASVDDGKQYIFSREDADIVVGEDGILLGDEIEVAFRGKMDELQEGQLQPFDYVHITVYGQSQDVGE